MNNKRLTTMTVVPALTMALLAPPLPAASVEERGRRIAAEWDRRDTGWKNMTAGLRMVLRNRHGQESTRRLRTKSLEMEGDGDKLLITFDHPRDVKGTNFLSFTHVTGPDDQWLQWGIHFIQVTPTSCGWAHGASASQSATIDRYGVGSTATACCTRR